MTKHLGNLMEKMLLIIAFYMLATATVPASEMRCDRQCLIKTMDQYLTALTNHNPSAAPLAPTVKFVENTRKTEIGKGLWETISAGPQGFRIHVADQIAGQVGFIGVIHVKGQLGVLGARLKIVQGKISEIDHLVVLKSGDQIVKNFIQPRDAFLQPLKPSEKRPRDQMLSVANSYYDSIVKVNGKLAPFARECQRRENGIITANHPNQPREEAATDDFSVFRKMG